MLSKISAGLALYRTRAGNVEILLVHPGGPFWKHKDAGVWSIPKGEIKEGEIDLLGVAQREFQEETGFIPTGTFTTLGSVKNNKTGKILHAWAFAGDCDPTQLRSNTCFIDWPPRSGKELEIPEVDRAEFFTLTAARSAKKFS